MHYAIACVWALLLLLPLWLADEGRPFTLAQAMDQPASYLQQFRQTYQLPRSFSEAPVRTPVSVNYWQNAGDVTQLSNTEDRPDQAQTLTLMPIDNGGYPMTFYPLHHNLLFLSSLLALAALLTGAAWQGLSRLRFHGAQPRPTEPDKEVADATTDAYRILGVSRDDPDAVIRQAYYRLMARHHPDKTAHLDAGQQAQAQEKSRAINAAWQAIRRQRRNPPPEAS